MAIRQRCLAGCYSCKTNLGPEIYASGVESSSCFASGLIRYDPQWTFMRHGEPLQVALPRLSYETKLSSTVRHSKVQVRILSAYSHSTGIF